MTTWQDAARNQRGRVEGADPQAPTLLLGSHLDTVVDAGRYDGMLGVVMAIEAVAMLREAIETFPFAVEVIAFFDEERTRFGKALLGSSAAAGVWDEAWWELTDADGVSVRKAFARFGLNPARMHEAHAAPSDWPAISRRTSSKAPTWSSPASRSAS